MKIRKKFWSDGIRVQVEDWSRSYPGTYRKNDMLAMYPIANVSTIWHKKGDPIRFTLHFANECDLWHAVDRLEGGEKLESVVKDCMKTCISYDWTGSGKGGLTWKEVKLDDIVFTIA